MAEKRFYKSFKRKNKRSFFILVATILAIAISMIYFAQTLPCFYVENIHISGLHRLSSLDILQNASIPSNTSIFRLDLTGISSNIQRKLIMVRGIKIRRKLPATLAIEIEERTPYVYVQKEEKTWEVDVEGVILKEVETLGDLTMVSGVNPFTEKDVLLKTLKAFHRAQISGIRVEEIRFSKGNEGIVLILMENIRVIMGTSPNYDCLVYLPAIFEDARKKGEKFNQIDLRFNNQIIMSK